MNNIIDFKLARTQILGRKIEEITGECFKHMRLSAHIPRLGAAMLYITQGDDGYAKALEIVKAVQERKVYDNRSEIWVKNER